MTFANAKAAIGSTSNGPASYYGIQHHGNKTASGERFNMNGLTAAHRTLPLGCTIKVTNKDNGNSVVLKVNDRGPFHGNRILDVSKGAAIKLGFIKQGVTNVKIEVLSLPEKKERKNARSVKPVKSDRTNSKQHTRRSSDEDQIATVINDLNLQLITNNFSTPGDEP